MLLVVTYSAAARTGLRNLCRRHEETGASGSNAASLYQLAVIAVETSDLERASECLEGAIERHAEDGNDREHALALVLQARIRRRRGAVEAAEASVESALSIADGAFPTARIHRERAAIERERESLTAAEAALTAAESSLRTETFPVERARISVEWGRLTATRGERERAREHFEAAIERFEAASASHRASAVRDEYEQLETVEPSQLRED